MDFLKILKYIWIFLFCFIFLSLIAIIPFDKYQTKYMQERTKYRNVPQQHIDATERYVEAIEDGLEDTSKGILGRAPKKYYLPFFKQNNNAIKTNNTKRKTYEKPLYLRDKNNPNILYKYSK